MFAGALITFWVPDPQYADGESMTLEDLQAESLEF
jgi:hypothetical protein